MALDPTSPSSLPPLELAPGARIGAILSTYHSELTTAMLDSARRELAAAGYEQELVVLEVPGAFELPLVARRLAVRPDIAAVLCFGLVLKGETMHDEVIAAAVAQGVMQAGFAADKPVLFGVLTCNDLDQARARALPPDAGGVQDKGREVARAAVAQLAALKAAATAGQPGDRVGFGEGAT